MDQAYFRYDPVSGQGTEGDRLSCRPKLAVKAALRRPLKEEIMLNPTFKIVSYKALSEAYEKAVEEF